MKSIVTRGRHGPAPADVRPLAYALSRMAPGLQALILQDESWDEMLARREAAADIMDDLLAEVADTFDQAVAA